jgi:hypothetical protein
MSQSMPSIPHADHTGWDSLTADIVLADDRGDSAILAADPAALARFLDERRQLESPPATKTPDSES